MTKRTIYIYIHLPNFTQPVLAGAMTSVEEETFTGVTKQSFFRYAESYLKRNDRKAIDPIHLPIPENNKTIMETKLDDQQSSFPVVLDAAPDSWGRKRMHDTAGRDLTQFEFIMASGEDRSGFLAFGLNKLGAKIDAPWHFGRKQDLLGGFGLKLSEIDVATEEDIDRISDEQLQLLLRYGSSIGGARPKTTVSYDDRVFIAKPHKADDQYPLVRSEHAALTLARRLGLRAAWTEMRVMEGRDVILVERFDREVKSARLQRHGFLSAHAALGLPKRIIRPHTDQSYLKIAEAIRKISEEPVKDCEELWKRILFNMIVSNGDDHTRNHAFVERGGTWRLSPLYDVVPVPRRSDYKERRLALSFGKMGSNATMENLLSETSAFGLSQSQAESIAGAFLKDFQRLWRDTFHDAGINPEALAAFSESFAITEAFLAELGV